MINSFWEKWKRTAEKIGDFQFNAIFSVLYYFFVVPFGFVLNFFGDFLKLKDFPSWEKIEEKSGTIGDLKNQ